MKRELRFNEERELGVMCFLMCAGDTMAIDEEIIIVNGKEEKTCNELYDLFAGKVSDYREVGEDAIVTLISGQELLLHSKSGWNPEFELNIRN